MKKKVKQIARKFQKQMQALVDKNNSKITEISITCGGKKKVLAKKKQ